MSMPIKLSTFSKLGLRNGSVELLLMNVSKYSFNMFASREKFQKH